MEKARFDKMISSEEIRILITALGAGIGAEEKSMDKLRYHNIVIMTDADVDGSHIRTLLLTFFYRQMPEIIERGYLYIAQPPLYKVKKGKAEKYLKDDHALEEYLIEFGVGGCVLATKKGPLKPQELSGLTRKLIHAGLIMERLAKRVDSRIVEAIVWGSDLSREALKNQLKVKQELIKAKEYLTHNFTDLGSYQLEEKEDAEHSATRLIFKSVFRGANRVTTIDDEFLSTAEIHELIKLKDEFCELGIGPFEMTHADQTVKLKNLFAVRDYILAEGKRGQSIQRYKGLGEMNPEQLWDTTMNPVTRTLLQVKVVDAVEADQIFTVLMGDEVDPRREFIENNALNVRNLDV